MRHKAGVIPQHQPLPHTTLVLKANARNDFASAWGFAIYLECRVRFLPKMRGSLFD